MYFTGIVCLGISAFHLITNEPRFPTPPTPPYVTVDYLSPQKKLPLPLTTGDKVLTNAITDVLRHLRDF